MSIQHFSVKHYNKTLFRNDCLSHKLLCLNIKEFTPRLWKFTFYMWFNTFFPPSSSLGSSYLGSPQQLIYLHFAISLAASSFIPTCHYTRLHDIREFISTFFPHVGQLPIQHPFYSSFNAYTPNLASLTVSPNHSISAVPLMYSFLILSVQWKSQHLQLCLLLFFSATVLKPYIIAGITTDL